MDIEQHKLEGRARQHIVPSVRLSWRQSSVARTFVQWVVSVGLEEQVLQTDHHRVEVEDGLPVFAENVETDIAFEVDVGMVDLCKSVEPK